MSAHLAGIHLQCKTGFSLEGGFSGSSTDAAPLQDPTLTPFLADYLGEVVATGDTVEEAKGISQIALARCVGSNQQGQRP